MVALFQRRAVLSAPRDVGVEQGASGHAKTPCITTACANLHTNPWRKQRHADGDVRLRCATKNSATATQNEKLI